MTRGEQIAFARLLAATVPEGDELPRAADTDADAAFDAWLRAAPTPNRVGLRALLRAVGARLKTMDEREAAQWIEDGRGRLAGGAQVLARIASHCYYGDDGVMRALGYDARAVAARGQVLRAAEGRL